MNLTTSFFGNSPSWTEDKERVWREEHPREALLADDLCEIIKDPTGLRFYRWAALRFREDYLRKLASYVKDLPDEQIQSSRGAIFCSMLKRGGVHEYRPR